MESWPRSWVVVPRARPRARARAATSDDNLPDAPPLAHRAAQLHNQQAGAAAGGGDVTGSPVGAVQGQLIREPRPVPPLTLRIKYSVTLAV